MSDVVTMDTPNNKTTKQVIDEVQELGWNHIVIIGLNDDDVFERISSCMTNERYAWLLQRASFRHMQDVED